MKFLFLSFLPRKLSPPSTILSSSFLASIFIDSLSTDFINDETPSIVFLAESPLNKKEGKILPDCIILDNWVFENFILADEPFVKVLKIVETCVSVNNNLSEKLVSIRISNQIWWKI